LNTARSPSSAASRSRSTSSCVGTTIFRGFRPRALAGQRDGGRVVRERPVGDELVDAVVALAMAVDRQAFRPEPVELVGWL
jgi:hypothetical protein